MRSARHRKTNSAWPHFSVEFIKAESIRALARRRGAVGGETLIKKGTQFQLCRIKFWRPNIQHGDYS